ncbi:Protein of unknown function [Pyronema omphalodes CBS 100304]|uniref:Uncharacterized protein n=1 Tax=Pyronema omphalodes (strain CBS 100304) TaxID=1076935 RepID=U4LX21_PYROM|nr:Protein of unknown function [Pyronema omphalodes CBS 100304]
MQKHPDRCCRSPVYNGSQCIFSNCANPRDDKTGPLSSSNSPFLNNQTTTKQQPNNNQTTTKQPPNNHQTTTKQPPNNHHTTTTQPAAGRWPAGGQPANNMNHMQIEPID